MVFRAVVAVSRDRRGRTVDKLMRHYWKFVAAMVALVVINLAWLVSRSWASLSYHRERVAACQELSSRLKAAVGSTFASEQSSSTFVVNCVDFLARHRSYCEAKTVEQRPKPAPESADNSLRVLELLIHVQMQHGGPFDPSSWDPEALFQRLISGPVALCSGQVSAP